MTNDLQRDRIRTDILWQRFIAVLEDQAQMLIRTAFSTTRASRATSRPGSSMRAGG